MIPQKRPTIPRGDPIRRSSEERPGERKTNATDEKKARPGKRKSGRKTKEDDRKREHRETREKRNTRTDPAGGENEAATCAPEHRQDSQRDDPADPSKKAQHLKPGGQTMVSPCQDTAVHADCRSYPLGSSLEGHILQEEV